MENNNLVFNHEGTMVTSSRRVAKDFGKRHADVLKTIDEKMSQNEKLRSVKYFIKTSYTDSTGKSNKEYLLTRNGFSFVVLGFNGLKADEFKINYIEAFNSMEERLKRLSIEENKEYKKVLLCAYGNVYPLEQAIDVINAINGDCNIRTVGELVGYLKDDKLLLNNNKISSLGYKNRFLVIVDGKICLSEKCIRRIVTRGTNSKATTVMSENNGINNLEDKQISFSIKEFEDNQEV